MSALGAMIGSIIGSGIFRVPSTVAAHLPTPAAFLGIWVIGGLFALCGAWIYAEYAAMYPVTGGRYVYLREGVGRLPAFVYAWTSTLLLQPVSIGAIALVFSAYLATVFPALVDRQREVAMALLLIIGVINYRSALLGAGLASVTMLAKALALTAMAMVILVAVSPEMATPTTAVSTGAVPWNGFALALVTVMWTYSGWDTPTLLTGEVRDAEQVMPRVLVGGIVAMIVLFVVVNIAYLRALGIEGIAASGAVAADAVGRGFGLRGVQAVGVLVALSTLGSLCVSLLSSPRLVFALGQDFPRLGAFGRVHQAHGTPHIGVLVTMLLAMVCVWNRTFEQLAETFILGSWPFQMLVAYGLIRLRRIRPAEHRPFRTPWYPMVPIAFLLVSTVMLVSASLENPRHALLGTLLILGGVPVYFVLRSRSS
jgi:APA family basic amino acid/polyamine antiporter